MPTQQPEKRAIVEGDQFTRSARVCEADVARLHAFDQGPLNLKASCGSCGKRQRVDETV